jgi:hypothetical protein
MGKLKTGTTKPIKSKFVCVRTMSTLVTCDTTPKKEGPSSKS